MTVREFKNMVAAIDPADDDCIVVTPMKTDLPGIFAFEGVCPGVSGMVDFGPSPDWIQSFDSNNGQPMRALLIAPHSFHDEDEHEPLNAQVN